MSAIPGSLEGIVGILLLLADGFIFGIAAKKAIMSAILIVVGLLLAGFIGIVVPFVSVGDVWTHIVNILISQAGNIGVIFYAFPIFWIIGFVLGLWKG